MSDHFKIKDGVAVALTPEEETELAEREAEHAAAQVTRQAETDRHAGLSTDQAVIDLANRLSNATTQQIDTWFTNNVTNPAQAIAVLKTLCKILAVRLPPRG